MPGTRKMFSQAELEKIEQEVYVAEQRTSGEIVPLVVAESADYAWTHWAFAAVGLLLATLGLFLAHRSAPWEMSLFSIVSWQALGAASGLVLSLIPAVRRLVIPASWRREAVHRQCLANFMALGLHETRDRTGVLIYVSMFEHQVEILADRGIHEKTGQEYWQAQVRGLIGAIRSGKPTEGLCQAIREIGSRLAEGFPRREDDRNEHANALRFGHQRIHPSSDDSK